MQKGQEIPPAQAPYYPQVGSALYAWTFNLDVDGIGLSGVSGKQVLEGEETKRRRELALDALAEMLDNKVFGAKLTRFTPFIDYEVIVASASKQLKFTVSPPVLQLRSFLAETVNRASRALEDVKGSDIKVLIWCKEEPVKKLADQIVANKNFAEIVVSDSVRDLFNKLKAFAL